MLVILMIWIYLKFIYTHKQLQFILNWFILIIIFSLFPIRVLSSCTNSSTSCVTRCQFEWIWIVEKNVDDSSQISKTVVCSWYRSYSAPYHRKSLVDFMVNILYVAVVLQIRIRCVIFIHLCHQDKDGGYIL